MMKKLAKLTALLAAAAFLLTGFPACSSDDDDGDPTLDKIEIKVDENEVKTTYTVGEDFDRTGITVTATYSDGSTKDVSDEAKYEATCNGTEFTTATAGDFEVTLTATYGGKTDSVTCPIEVKAGETTGGDTGDGGNTGSGNEGGDQGDSGNTGTGGGNENQGNEGENQGGDGNGGTGGEETPDNPDDEATSYTEFFNAYSADGSTYTDVTDKNWVVLSDSNSTTSHTFKSGIVVKSNKTGDFKVKTSSQQVDNFTCKAMIQFPKSSKASMTIPVKGDCTISIVWGNNKAGSNVEGGEDRGLLASVTGDATIKTATSTAGSTAYYSNPDTESGKYEVATFIYTGGVGDITITCNKTANGDDAAGACYIGLVDVAY